MFVAEGTNIGRVKSHLTMRWSEWFTQSTIFRLVVWKTPLPMGQCVLQIILENKAGLGGGKEEEKAVIEIKDNIGCK